MKKFLSTFLLSALPVMLLLVGVNYFGDAAKLFDTEYEKKMAGIILNGKNVTNIENFDDRLFQKELISSKKINPEILIIGSSRTMQLNSGLFPGKRLFNSSLTGATVQDLTAIYQLYKENNKLPKKIIIGIDPWTFNENSDQERWLSISEYYHRFHGTENHDGLINKKYKELVSLSYFQSSLKNIPKLYKGSLEPLATNERDNKTNSKLTDGSLSYDKAFREATQEQVKTKMQTYISGDVYSVENFIVVSEKLWGDFEKLVADMHKNNIEVELFISPYAPLVYDRIKEEYPMVIKSEENLRQYADKKDIKLYGSFNPYVLKMDETYFYDGMHCKEFGLKKILENK